MGSPGDFLRPVLTRMLAPVTAAASASVNRAMLRATGLERWGLVYVKCLRCHNVIAVYRPHDGRLYMVSRTRGGYGTPLGTARRADIQIRCDRCRRSYGTSGRAVGYRLRKGLDPLA